MTRSAYDVAVADLLKLLDYHCKGPDLGAASCARREVHPIGTQQSFERSPAFIVTVEGGYENTLL